MAGKRRWGWFFLLGTVLVCLVGMMPMHRAAAAGEPKETKHVLVLYSFRTILPTQTEIDQGLRAALKTGSRHPVDIDMEYLDIGRFEEAAYLDELLHLLRRKYAHRRLDVIIPVFDPAVKFLLKYGDAIFPGVPVVFAGEFKQFLQNLTLKPHMTGVYVEPELAANLQLALRLQPQTRRVMVVGGTSGADRVFLSWAKEAFAPHSGQVEFTYLTDLSLAELQEQAAHLPPHTIIFYVTIFRDGKGQEFLPRDALNLLAQAANAPVYGVWDTLLGEGIVGGSLISHQEQGRLAGELAARVLNGENPGHIPPLLAPNRLLFDWRQLRRWGIPEHKLPPGSQVSFKELSLWESYRGWIIGILALLGLQTVLIGALLITRARRRRAELRYRIVADFTYDWESWENPDGSLNYVSPACERISGHTAEEFLARPHLFRETIVPEDREIWDRHLAHRQQGDLPQEIQFRLQRPDGGIRWLEHVCRPVYGDQGEFLGFRASNRDVTLRKHTERQEQQHRDELTHVMRVATLGELTASLAHEFNQPLNAVLNNAQAALRFLNRATPDVAEVEAALKDIARDGKRASAVIQRLRSFLKPGMMHLEGVDTNGVIQEAAALVQNELLSRHIATHFTLAPYLPPVRGDRIQLQQVVLNLLLNAMEAMEQTEMGPREIHLKTEQENPDSITVSLKDTGRGLTGEELEKIFEPFWTSKAEGLGLGLSICRSIISAHGGRLRATANADRGATLLFTLPLYQRDSDEP